MSLMYVNDVVNLFATVVQFFVDLFVGLWCNSTEGLRGCCTQFTLLVLLQTGGAEMNEGFGIRLDPELAELLRQEAKRRHCSLSQVIRDALVEWLADKDNGRKETSAQ